MMLLGCRYLLEVSAQESLHWLQNWRDAVDREEVHHYTTINAAY
jgi:hypothetical protein